MVSDQSEFFLGFLDLFSLTRPLSSGIFITVLLLLNGTSVPIDPAVPVR